VSGGTAVQDDPALAGIAERFTPVDWDDAWNAQPDQVEWLIEPLIERGQSVALFARPDTGKSLLALECAAAKAAGRGVLGNPASEPVTIVYIDAENRLPTLVSRLQEMGYKPADLARLVLYSFPPIRMLDSFPGGQEVLALAVTNDAVLVIIDTTSRVVGGKENDADTYLALYRHTIVPLRALGIALLRLDHPGKDVSRGPRGSSAKTGDVDSEWRLSRNGEDFDLVRQKDREHHGAGQVKLRRRFGPLRHEVAGAAVPGDKVEELIDHLDRLGVPWNAGRIVAGKALRDAGIAVRTEDLEAAVRRRKAGGCPTAPTY
jgi:hypothetical protein